MAKRSALIELFTRLIKPQDRRDKIYCNGADNNYPERIERIINNSVTAKLSVDKFIRYLVGMGFSEEINETIINKKKNLTFYDILRRVAKDVAYQKAFALHVNYNGLGEVDYLDVLPFKNCRVSEEDDNGYSGYVWYQKQWKLDSVLSVRKKDNKNWYYPYNPNPEVIAAQRINDAPKDANEETLVRSYRGQVLFVNLDHDSIYPNSPIDPAYNDADTEYRISVFRNDRVKTGFIGATVAVIPETADDEEWRQKQEEFKTLLGAENSSNILLLEAKTDGDKPLSDYVHIETIESTITSKQFEYDEKTIQENILNCYRVPKPLVKSSDGALFGQNADALRVNQQMFQEEIEPERKAIEKVFSKIFPELDFEIEKLIDDDLNDGEEIQETEVVEDV